MNPGYLSYVLMSIMLILLASGWKDILFRGFSRTSILLFFVGWIPLSLIRVPLWGSLQVGLSAVFLLALILWATAGIRGIMSKLHVWSSGILLGMFEFLMLELNGWNMLLDHAGPFLNSGVVLAFLTMLLGRRARWQFVALSVGLLSADFIHGWIHRDAAAFIVIGGASFSDHWWYAFCLARGVTVTFEQAFRFLLSSAKLWANRRNEWGE